MPQRFDRSALALVALSSSLLVAPAAARAERFVDARASTAPRRTYVRPFVTAGAGMGLRFNNPFRLATPLGERAESVSTTAPYLSLGVGAAFGDPLGLQHGPILRWDRSVTGVPQNVLVPSYALLARGAHLGGFVRAAFPILLSPDPNVGIELGVGGAWYALGGVGLTAEVIGDLFWGAATPDNRRPAYPVLSGQLGVVVEWERLP